MSSGVETSLDIFNSKPSRGFLDFAPNDGHEDTTSRLFSSLHIYHDNSPRSAAMNMAIDEALIEHAMVASIRFYRWHSPALSFGYFGKFADVGHYAAERDLVRRWTGGGTVFHGDDLTYSIVIPSSDPVFGESSMSIYEKIHRALATALAAMGQHAQLATPNSAVTDRRYSEGACFANPVRSDVMVNGCKVAGAAQRRTRAGLLHQGSIQGVDLGNGLAERFARELSGVCPVRKIDNGLCDQAKGIAARKYGTEDWLRKR
jgi:lipoate-protein ligase A